MTDIENQAFPKQSIGAPIDTQINNKNTLALQDGKKAKKCCLSKPAIIATIVVLALFVILISVFLFTAVLKDDEKPEALQFDSSDINDEEWKEEYDKLYEENLKKGLEEMKQREDE